MSVKSHHQLLLNAGPPLWTPHQLFASGERGVWIDPSDFSTMWQNSAGTNPVTATGQSVGLIHDKSGNGIHFLQATSGNKPTLQQDGSGNYYLQFTAANSTYLQAAAGAGDVNGLYSDTLSISVVTGFKLDSASGNQAIIARSWYGSYGGRWWQNARSGGNMETGSQFSTGIVAANSFSSTAITVCSSDIVRPASSGTGTNTTRVNASQVATASASDAAGSAHGNLLVLIGAYNAANNTGPQSGFYLDGRIYGLIVRIAVFDSSLRDLTETWMDGKCLAY